MNLSLVSPFVYLASEKISAENLFEGFNVDLQSTVDLIKSLSSYNPTVWTYMSSITKKCHAASWSCDFISCSHPRIFEDGKEDC